MKTPIARATKAVTKLRQPKTAIHFTQAEIEKLPLARVERHSTGKIKKVWTKKYYDKALPSFYVSVGAGTKTYYVRGYLSGSEKKEDVHVQIGPTTDSTVEEARKKAKKFRQQLEDGDDPRLAKRKENADALTLAGALDLYCGKENAKVKASTKNATRGLVEYHLSKWLEKPIATITDEMVLAQHRKITERVATTPRGLEAYEQRLAERPNGENQANDVMRKLRRLWNYAKQKKYPLPENPVVLGLKGEWHQVGPRSEVIPEALMKEWFEALMADHNETQRDCCLLMLFAGLRRGEATALQWSEVDFRSKVIKIGKQRTKMKRTFALPMNDLVLELLMTRKKQGESTEFVFPTDKAGTANDRKGNRTKRTDPGHIKEPRAVLDRIGEATGVRVRPHDLKRTYATVAESVDLSAHSLNALLNHAPKRDVAGQHYVILTPDRLREPAQRVANRFKTLCGIASTPAQDVPEPAPA